MRRLAEQHETRVADQRKERLIVVRRALQWLRGFGDPFFDDLFDAA